MTDAGPCPACPWRTSNQGRRHPDGWYTKANLTRLWAGMRRGESMSCHPTDPRMTISAAAKAAGYREAPEHSQMRECAGALIVQQREFTILDKDFGADLKAYRKARPRGLTRDGVMRLLERYLFGGSPLGGPRLPTPELNNDDISVPWLEWTPREDDK